MPDYLSTSSARNTSTSANDDDQSVCNGISLLTANSAINCLAFSEISLSPNIRVYSLQKNNKLIAEAVLSSKNFFVHIHTLK